MTDARWYFKKQPKGFRDRNPIQNAFFDSEQVGSLVSALIREGTQNSGDAASDDLPDDEPVRVRIFVSGKAHALPADKIAVWGCGLWNQVAAKDSGLRNPPTDTEACRFIIFEDFGTTGLEGAPSTDVPCKEPFYCFFRAENATSKGADAGGSWGVGKTAFPRASRANAFFALTNRESDNKTLLMGSLTLRTRHVEGEKYSPDSWFGMPQADEEEGGVIQPIEDSQIIQQFHDDFNLMRPLSGKASEQKGTSVVVPWCSNELTKDSIVRAVVESNFLPIIGGEIEVTVCDGLDSDQHLVLNAESIEDIVVEMDVPDLLASVRLAKWMREKGAAARVSAVHEPSDKSVKWDQYSLPESERERLRERFDTGKPVLVRVPVPMRQQRKHGGGVHTSHIEVALQRTEHGNTIRPVFVRGTVVVPDQKIRSVPGALALIRTEKDALGNLLRAAEDPGHKEWSTETDDFKDFKEAYVYASSYLTLARHAASRAQRLLQDEASEVDFDLLGDVFSLPKSPDDDGYKQGQKGGKKKRKKKKVKKIKRGVQMALQRQVKGGFCVARASAKCPTPERVTVLAGYDHRGGGDPIRKWHPADFEFEKAPIAVECEGAEMEHCEGNEIRMRVTDPGYKITVTGFSASRGDISVRVRSEGRFDA